jgi:hypothetical protein
MAETAASAYSGTSLSPTRRSPATGDENRRVMVYISGSAMTSDTSGLPQEVAAAKDTHSRSVLAALVAVDDPPRQVMVSTCRISWTLPD